MRAIITGGAGFIGSALVRFAVQKLGWDVLNIDKLTYAGDLSSVQAVAGNPSYHFLQADIGDGPLVSDAIAGFQPDLIVHLAAESHVDRGIDRPAEFIRTNLLGTYTLLAAARSYWESLPAERRACFRLHHVSTDEVYGSLDHEGVFSETSSYAPRNPYSASKAGSDHLVQAWYHTYGLPILITRSSNNFGPYQHSEKLIPHVILNALEGKPIPVYGRGENIRDWLYVEDHVKAIGLAAVRGRIGQTYNFGARNERKNIDLVRKICDILDRKRPDPQGTYHRLITFVADRPGHDKRYAIDASRLENELGWRARENFDSGIRRTVEWYLANEWWWKPIREGKYAGERLGRS